MSTDWGVGCQDCDVFESYEECRDVDALGKLIACAPQVAAAAAALDRVEGPALAVDLFYNCGHWHADPIKFIRAHAGHRLRVTNEHGQYLGDCGHFLYVREGGTVRPCRLPKGHPPPCLRTQTGVSPETVSPETT